MSWTLEMEVTKFIEISCIFFLFHFLSLLGTYTSWQVYPTKGFCSNGKICGILIQINGENGVNNGELVGFNLGDHGGWLGFDLRWF